MTTMLIETSLLCASLAFPALDHTSGLANYTDVLLNKPDPLRGGQKATYTPRLAGAQLHGYEWLTAGDRAPRSVASAALSGPV
ncbi:hypothetical protein AB0K49_08115 [Streptomyces decoyicus]|uniref:hypothetical protein n=1 Tax=Streptomyces decoyicus TaxID=249567 RepID=UPI00345D8CAF